MYATRHIDWLSITVNSTAEIDRVMPSADWHFVGAGRHGYKSAYQDAITQARVETDSAAAGMDTHLTLGGGSLSQVRSSYPDGDDGIVRVCCEVGARVSRIDLAINAHEGKLTVDDFHKAYKKGNLETQFRRVYYVQGVNDETSGDTLYLGSPKSDRQLRIYNKAAEQGIVDGKAWLRLELALRDVRAKAALVAMRDNLVDPTISAHMVSCLTWNNAEFTAMVGDVGQPVKAIPRKETSTERWLRDQCAPALAKVVAVKPDFMVQFVASFQASLDKLNSSE